MDSQQSSPKELPGKKLARLGKYDAHIGTIVFFPRTVQNSQAFCVTCPYEQHIVTRDDKVLLDSDGDIMTKDVNGEETPVVIGALGHIALIIDIEWPFDQDPYSTPIATICCMSSVENALPSYYSRREAHIGGRRDRHRLRLEDTGSFAKVSYVQVEHRYRIPLNDLRNWTDDQTQILTNRLCQEDFEWFIRNYIPGFIPKASWVETERLRLLARKPEPQKTINSGTQGPISAQYHHSSSHQGPATINHHWPARPAPENDGYRGRRHSGGDTYRPNYSTESRQYRHSDWSYRPLGAASQNWRHKESRDSG